MRFEEAYEGWHAGALTQAEAAQILGMCDRSFRRYLSKYEADGLEGLIDRRLDQVALQHLVKCLPVLVRLQATNLRRALNTQGPMHHNLPAHTAESRLITDFS